jgi:predicted transcriptional regulator
VQATQPIEVAIRVMAGHACSQISVTKNGRIIMQPAFPFIDISTPVELLSTPENPAVLIRDFKTDKTFIITRSDVIRVLTQVRGERGAAAR